MSKVKNKVTGLPDDKKTMDRPFFLGEFIEDFGFWFEVIDKNPFPKPDIGWTKEFEEEEYDGTIGDPWASDYQPTWKREDKWDDEFKSLWKWAGSHGMDNGGEWKIAHHCLQKEWEGAYLVHQYRYSPSIPYFFSNNSNTRFLELLDSIENTSEEVGIWIETAEAEYDNPTTIQKLRESIEEECWKIKNQISYEPNRMLSEEKYYYAYGLKGIPSERNGTVIRVSDDEVYFVGHRKYLNDGLSEAKVLRGEIRNDQVVPEGRRKHFAVESSEPKRIYDIARDIFTDYEIGYAENN